MKRFFVTLILCLSIFFNYSFLSSMTAASYAAGTITAAGYATEYNIYDYLKYSGSIPTSSDEVTLSPALADATNPALAQVPYSRIFTNATAGDIVLHFCDSAGNAYTTTESNGTYTVTDTIAGVKSLTYTDTRMSLTVAATYTGTLNLYYYGSVTEGGDTYDTSVATYAITFSNEGVYFKSGYNGFVLIDAADVGNYTFDAAFAKNYVLAYYDNGTTYTADQLKYGELIQDPDTDEISYSTDGCIDTTLYNEYQEIPIYEDVSGFIMPLQVASIMVYIEQEVEAEDNLTAYIGGNVVPVTTSDSRHNVRIDAGQNITGHVVTTGSYSDIEVELSGNSNFSVVGLREYEGEEGSPAIGYNFTISQRDMQVGTFSLTLKISDLGTEYFENIYLTVIVSTAQAPVITIYASELEYYKGDDVAEILTALRDNIAEVTLYDGSTLDRSVIQNETKLIITCSLTDTTNAGSYPVSYSYTDEDTALVGTATAVVNIVDRPPEITSVRARVVGTDENVSTNEEIPLGTEVYFIINASDSEGDALTYYATSSKGSMVQDAQDTTKFTFSPTMAMAGSISFTFFVSDGHSTSENYQYTIIFKDETPPTITLADLDGDNSITLVYDDEEQTYTLQLRRDTTVYFRNYIESVADNSSTLSTNDVTITPTGFSFSGGVERYAFYDAGTFSVRYTLADLSGNTTNIDVSISIQNQAPTAQNKSYEFAYADTISFDLANLATDDTSGVEFIFVGSLTDSEGLPVIINNQSFSTTGSVSFNILPVYNETQERDIPFIGVCYLKYKAIDTDGELSPEYLITLNIVDDTEPVVTQVAGKQTSFIKGRTYADFTKEGFFTGFDEVDGELTPTSIKIYQGLTEVPSIDFATVIGSDREYQIVYIFTDAAGNETPRSVTINVVAGGNPTIEMLATTASIPLGGNFNIYDFMYRITDAEDGNITSGWEDLRNNNSLQIDDSTVDTNKAGTYTIRISYVDSDGNNAQTIEFTLTVEEPKEFPMEIIYYGAAALGGVLAIIIIRVIVIKRRMRI